MASPTEQVIRAILRETGRAMTAAEIGEQLAQRLPSRNPNPANTVRNVLSSNSRICVTAGRGIYTYLPAAINGASVRTSLRLVAKEGGLCAIGAELAVLLWPGIEPDSPRAPQLTLDEGPAVDVSWAGVNSYTIGYTYGPWAIAELAEPFWVWWAEQQRAGADQLVVCCEDGETGRYTATAVRSGALDDAAVEAANEGTRQAAVDAMRGHDRGSPWWQFLPRLLARGPYHRAVSPDPLAGILLLPTPLFEFSGFNLIRNRPNLTPDLASIFRDRLLLHWETGETLARERLGLAIDDGDRVPDFDPLADLGARAPAEPIPIPAPAVEVVQAVRFRVALQRMPTVWRSIEIREDQSFLDLHEAIQAAFGWDDDHLYSFYLSGQLGDQLTEIERPTTVEEVGERSFFAEYDPIFASEVAIGDLEPTPKRSFLYLIDYGDELFHTVTVEAVAPADGGSYPRIVEGHGQAPPQYPAWEE